MPRSIAHYTLLSGQAAEAKLAVHWGDYWCDCQGDGKTAWPRREGETGFLWACIGGVLALMLL